MISRRVNMEIDKVPFEAYRLLGGDSDTEPNLRPARIPSGFGSEQ